MTFTGHTASAIFDDPRFEVPTAPAAPDGR
jgi:hypothetical protein